MNLFEYDEGDVIGEEDYGVDYLWPLVFGMTPFGELRTQMTINDSYNVLIDEPTSYTIHMLPSSEIPVSNTRACSFKNSSVTC